MARWLGVMEVERSNVRWASLQILRPSPRPPAVLELVGPEGGFRVRLASPSECSMRDATHGEIPWVLPKFSRDLMQP